MNVQAGSHEAIEHASLDELQRAAARAPQVVAAARLRERGALPAGVRRGGREARTSCAPSRTSRAFRSSTRRIFATTIRSGCSPCRASRSCASTPRAAPPASRPWWATRRATSTTGPALVARSIRAAGGGPGDIVHVAYGYGLFTGGLGAHYGAERLGCTVIPMSGGQTEKQVQLIRISGPTSSW